MNSPKRERILFSCLGTTDPIRGNHDGPMLHIVRKYRPDKIFWYISKEMKEKEQADNRYRRGIDTLCEQYPDYHPEILEPYYGAEDDVSDFDLFYGHFVQLLQDLSQKYPEAEILLNISSGTPQMKATLMLLAKLLNFKTLAVQVKNPEKKAGSVPRSNRQDYDVEKEIAENLDAAEGYEDRCVEPRLFVVERSRLRTQVQSLLNRYDYEALLQLGDSLPEQVMPLVHHLALRADYEVEKALEAARAVERIELYPADHREEPGYEEYRRISEYLLMLRLMQQTQRYTDLVIRLNPFVVQLQRAWLIQRGIPLGDMTEMDSSRGEVLVRGKMDPELLAFLNRGYKNGLNDRSPLSIVICNKMVAYLEEQGSETGDFFRRLGRLNANKRNTSAHALSNTTEEEIREIVGCGSAELMEQLVAVLRDVFPRYFQKELLDVYNTANKMILETL